MHPAQSPAQQSSPAAPGCIRVRQAGFSDYPRIAAVQAGNNLRCESRDEWARLWLENPAYEELGGDWPIGWVLENQSGCVVGTVSNIPLTYSFRGERLVAATWRGWAVDPEYRPFSLLLLAEAAAQPKVDLHVSTSAGGSSAAAVTGMHWSRVPVGQWDACALWITNYSGFVQNWIRMAAGSRARAINWVAAPICGVADQAARLTRERACGFDLEFRDRFDTQFDAFWGELRVYRPHLLLACRSSETLRWHFGPALAQNRLWILTASDRGRLAGYAICQRWDAPALGFTRVRIIDLQTVGGGRELCRALVGRVLRRCRKEGIQVLENPGRWLESPEILGRRAPFHRPVASWSFYYKPDRPDLVEPLRDPEAWYPTAFDGDCSL